MHGLLNAALVATATLAGQALAAPLAFPLTPVHPGGAQDLVITNQDTLNATAPAPGKTTVNGTKTVEDIAATSSTLPLAFVNNFAGDVNGYVTGLDAGGSLVFLQADGSFYYPTADSSETSPTQITADIAIPVGQGATTDITVPGYISSGRIYFANGDLQFFTVYSGDTDNPGLVQPSSTNPEDPNAGLNWGFVELTNTAAELYADVTYLDFVGLPLGLQLTAGDGSTQTALGTSPDAVSNICNALIAQGQSDGQPWGDLCQTYNGELIRVIGPQDYISLNSDAFSGYYDDYASQVWTYYETNTLTIDTQAAAGDVACTVSGGTLTCAGDNRGYAQPSTADVFGCNSGPFAIDASTDNAVHYAVVPRLCAGFDRSTLLLSGGNNQPDGITASDYYSTTPTNWFAKLVHENELDGLGYAFAYDDVSPDGSNGVSGNVVDGSGAPQLLQVIIGGPSS